MKKTHTTQKPIFIISSILILVIFCLLGCQKKENNCATQEVAFDLDLDLSSILDHETTNQTTHLEIFYEDYFDVGNLKSYQQYPFMNRQVFKESICLPITDDPTDSLIIAIKLIQDNAKLLRDPTIYLNIAYDKTEVNCVSEKINSTYLWDKPPCPGMPTVFQNIDAYIEGDQYYDILVAGGFGIGVNIRSADSIEEIGRYGDQFLLGYYNTGLCPCSKYYVKFR